VRNAMTGRPSLLPLRTSSSVLRWSIRPSKQEPEGALHRSSRRVVLRWGSLLRRPRGKMVRSPGEPVARRHSSSADAGSYRSRLAIVEAVPERAPAPVRFGPIDLARGGGMRTHPLRRPRFERYASCRQMELRIRHLPQPKNFHGTGDRDSHIAWRYLTIHPVRGTSQAMIGQGFSDFGDIGHYPSQRIRSYYLSCSTRRF